VRPVGSGAPRTIDLETRGWEVYLIHHDRAQVARDGRRVRELLWYE